MIRRSSIRISGLGCLLVSFLFAIPAAGWLQAQQSKALPRPEFYQAVGLVYQGKYEQAGKQFQRLSSNAYKDLNGKFLDSVCYWTLLGESHFHLGNYAQAMEQYEAAVNLYMDFQQWPIRTKFPAQIQTDGAANRRAQVPWTKSTRRFTVGRFETMLVLFGKTPQENQAVLQNPTGGIIDPERLRSVDLPEVMRCVALSLDRMKTIKGATCKFDPFTKRVSVGLVANAGGMAGAWQGVVKGIGLAAMDEDQQAASILQNSLQVNGTFDHPLTPIALLTLGKIAQKNQKWDLAQQMYLEASVSAAAFQQYDIIEESLRNAANLFSVGRTGQEYTPLNPAIAWAKKDRADPLSASLLVQQAMLSAESGNAQSAKDLLDRARSDISRDMRNTKLMTRWSYVSSMANYLEDDLKNGDKDFELFLRGASKNSLWLFQVAMADQLVKTSRVSERESELLYDALLREPTDLDWLVDPIETMAFQSTPRSGPMERWFEIALRRKAEEKAVGIAELIRRQRFFQELPFGGRLMAMRWVTEAPNEALSTKAADQKMAILARYPAFKQLMDEAKAIRQKLEALPISPDVKSNEHLEQRKLLGQLAMVVAEQELFLRKIVLQREPVEMAFPRPWSLSEIQQQMTPQQSIISMLQIGSRYYVMNLTNNRYSIESVIQSKTLDRKILMLLKQIGLSDKASTLEVESLQNEEWRTTAREISALIFEKTDPQSMAAIDEIVFVPDGKAWYLPMELLQVGSGDETTNLVEQVKIRYAPMAGLAVPDKRLSPRFRRSAIVALRNFIRDEPEMIAKGLAEFQKAMPDTETLDNRLPGPSSLIASTLDQLFVWHDNRDNKRGGLFDLAPMQFDYGKPGANLASWLQLPWRGVERIVMPGISTNIEGSTRTRADGSELFLTTCSLMASGSRTILISRWRVGGQSTIDLTREFALGMNLQPATESWKRSIKLLSETELDLDAEPRIRSAVLDQPLKLDHPFFWAGYLLVDTGFDPSESEAEPQENLRPEADQDDDGR